MTEDSCHKHKFVSPPTGLLWSFPVGADHGSGNLLTSTWFSFDSACLLESKPHQGTCRHFTFVNNCGTVLRGGPGPLWTPSLVLLAPHNPAAGSYGKEEWARDQTPTCHVLMQCYINSTTLGKLTSDPQFRGAWFLLKPTHLTHTSAHPIPQHLPSTAGTVKHCTIPTPVLQVEELQSSQRAILCPETLTYSREGAEHPLRGGLPPSCGFQEHPGSRTPHPAALWHEASGLESAEAVETESRLFTGKQFSLVCSHVWLQHTGLHAMPGEGHGGGRETEIFCVLPARLEQFDDGDPLNPIYSFTRNRSSRETEQPHGRTQKRSSLLGFLTNAPSVPNKFPHDWLPPLTLFKTTFKAQGKKKWEICEPKCIYFSHLKGARTQGLVLAVLAAISSDFPLDVMGA